MGYLNEPEKTNEIIDDQYWLHSGDIGKQDQDGFLYITGRIKGKYLAYTNQILNNADPIMCFSKSSYETNC